MRLNKFIVLLKHIFVFMVFSNACYAGGISAWEDVTPNGNKLYYDGGSDGLVKLAIRGSDIWVKEFYFYKNHIVAKTATAFYIVNEKGNKIEIFHSKLAFDKAVEEKKLDPIFIVRWFDENYGSDRFWIPFSLVLFPLPFFMPIVWIICVVSLLRQSDKMLFLKRGIVIGYPVISLFVWIISFVPQSF